MDVRDLSAVLWMCLVLDEGVAHVDSVVPQRRLAWASGDLVPVVVDFNLHLLVGSLASEWVALKGVCPHVADWVVVAATARVGEPLLTLLDRNDVDAVVLLDGLWRHPVGVERPV